MPTSAVLDLAALLTEVDEFLRSRPVVTDDLTAFLAGLGHAQPRFSVGNVIDWVSFTAMHMRSVIAGRCGVEHSFPMRGLSDSTLGVLTEAGQALTASHLKTVLLKAGIFYDNAHDSDKHELIRWRLLRARDDAREGDDTAARGLLTFATELVQRTVRIPADPPSWFAELRDALLADGYELTWDGEPPRTLGQGWAKFATPGTIRYKILPTDAAPVPLATEISALEAELAARGYTSVLNHYRQAVDGFANHKYESANGDLRTALEDLVTRLAEDHAGYQRQPRAGQGGTAITHMIESGRLPESDGGMLLRGLWKLSHTNGSHPGQSDADEARFRMQVITATARFLLRHFPVAA